MKTKITVTRSDIKMGLQRKAKSCPIALALKNRKIPFLSVDSDRIILLINDECKRIPLSKRAEKFIKVFDEGGARKVKPFSFIINLPEYK